MQQTNQSMAEKIPPVSNETVNSQGETKEPRRAFTIKYKLSILTQADQCENAGDIGALLRRESLYSSHLSNWRRLRRDGTLLALEPKQRGPKAALPPAERRELEQLRRRNAKLERELEKAHTIIDVQKNSRSSCRLYPRANHRYECDRHLEHSRRD
jgi:transposase